MFDLLKVTKMAESDTKKILDGQSLAQKHFDDFYSEWKTHRAEAKIAMNQVSLLHSTQNALVQNLSHLAQLPVIATSITNMQTTNSQLVTAIADKERSVNKFFNGVIWILIFIVAAFAICFVLVFLKERDFQAGVDGVKITKSSTVIESKDPNVPLPPSIIDNKKTN